MTNWIPTEKILPKEDEMVLFCVGGLTIWHGHMFKSGGVTYWVSEDGAETGTASHWMHLPSPPNECEF